MRVLVTGGAGFVGSTLATRLKAARSDISVVALDNLHRRGSELALARLRDGGVDFIHGDIRLRDDLEAAGGFHLMLECSAEPSVHAGSGGDPSYIVGSNLIGTINCLESCRRAGADVVFFSTSRVYPIEPLRALPLADHGERLEIPSGQRGTGWSENGISAAFPLSGHRSLYGATKLASELLVEEYRHAYGLRAIVNRCGVIAGPWQMGKVDQGFVTLWAARHLWGTGLSYTGFGGEGRQVRDVLHIDDLFELVEKQMRRLSDWNGLVVNVGGGRAISVSLRELTALCVERSGRRIPIGRVEETAAADIPYYVTDNDAVTTITGWQPRRTVETLLNEIFEWLRANEAALRPVLG